MIETIYRLARSTLRTHLEQAESDYHDDDGDFVVQDHRLALSVTFDGFASQSDQIIAPVEIQIHVDGDDGNRFRVGTLGIGPSEDDALTAAVQEWHLLAAAPLLSALGAAAATRRDTVESMTIGNWNVFPGRAGVRGAVPAGLQVGGALYPLLIKALSKTIVDWGAPDKFTLHSIFVMANRVEQEVEAQAAVDGIVDQTLAANLATLAWPSSGEPYFYKQLFVVRGGKDEQAGERGTKVP